MSHPRSLLDPGQIIKDAYDESSQAIRVELDSDISIGTVEITSGDNSGNKLNINGAGAIATTQGSYTVSQFVRNDYTSTNVTTAAYVQLIASTSHAYQQVQIQDTSGQTLELALGGSGSEVPFIIIPQGGTYPINFQIASGSRISIKALSGTANAGEIDLQLLG